MGGTKGLLPIRAAPSASGTTFLARCAWLLARPTVAAVVAVLGHDAERVRAEARLPPETLMVVNPRHREGMLTSIWAALAAAEAEGADAILLHLVDHPLVHVDTVDRVLAGLAENGRIVVPSHERRRGHPAGFARDAWPALRAATPERGARGVLHDHPDWIVHVAGDPGCVAGIDTPEDYRRLLGEP